MECRHSIPHHTTDLHPSMSLFLSLDAVILPLRNLWECQMRALGRSVLKKMSIQSGLVGICQFVDRNKYLNE